MTEDEVRIIVLDELHRHERDKAARTAAWFSQQEAARQEKLIHDPSDGPVTSHIKAILRGESAVER